MAVRFHKPIKFKFSREREYRPTITSSLGGFPEEFSFLSSLGLTHGGLEDVVERLRDFLF